jgi:hypothetical protein
MMVLARALPIAFFESVRRERATGGEITLEQ